MGRAITTSRVLSADEAFRVAAAAKDHRGYPGHDDRRARGGVLWPDTGPSFSLDFGGAIDVFTIGSCFARNIEEALQPLGVRLPTRTFVTPEAERGPARPNGILNEFNPGTMRQRILRAFSPAPWPDDTLVPAPGGIADLLLCGGADVPMARAQERRAEVDAVYRALPGAACVVVTLGLVEAWYDTRTRLYLNRMPPVPVIKAHKDRFQFHRLSVDECVDLLEPALDAVVGAGSSVVLTVSPVPIQTTLTGDDCVLANEVSKSTLRLAAEHLRRVLPRVDYFPSYEIVRSGGLASYEADHVHVKDAVVRQITAEMVARYAQAPARDAEGRPLQRPAA